MKTLQVEISETVYKRIRSEITVRLLCQQESGIIDEFVAKLFKSWDNDEVPVLKFKSEGESE